MKKDLAKYLVSQAWYRKNFEATAWANYQWAASLLVQRRNPFFRKHFKEVMTITTNFWQEWFWRQDDLESVRQWLVSEIKKDFKFAKTLVAKWKQNMRRHERNLKRVENLNLRKCTDQELVLEFRKFYNDYLETSSIAVINEGFSLNAERWLGELFFKFLKKKKHTGKFSEYFSLLSRTTRSSYVQEAAIAKKQGMKASKLAKNYFYVHFNYLHTTPLTERFFKSWSPEPAPNLKIIKRKKSALMKRLALPKDLRNLFLAVDLFTWWQDQRKKHALLFAFWTYKFLFEAGRRGKIPKKYLFRALPFEFEELVSRPPEYLKTLKRRSDPFLVYTRDTGENIIWSGKRGNDVLQALNRLDKVGVVKGSPTYLGLVQGQVAVVKGKRDFHKMKKGAILLASMTRPEYTPILHLASAIVTDEGGITSHAAIVSREFGIPCVIGTKFATKVFKDGDMVEVDATRGVIRKL